jgi:hypothetical protein
LEEKSSSMRWSQSYDFHAPRISHSIMATFAHEEKRTAFDVESLGADAIAQLAEGWQMTQRLLTSTQRPDYRELKARFRMEGHF